MSIQVRKLLSDGIEKLRNSTTLDDKLINSVNSARSGIGNTYRSVSPVINSAVSTIGKKYQDFGSALGQSAYQPFAQSQMNTQASQNLAMQNKLQAEYQRQMKLGNTAQAQRLASVSNANNNQTIGQQRNYAQGQVGVRGKAAMGAVGIGLDVLGASKLTSPMTATLGSVRNQGVRSAFTGLVPALAKTGVGAALPAAFGGGMAALTGGDIRQGIGQGLGQTFQQAGINAITNPLLEGARIGQVNFKGLNPGIEKLPLLQRAGLKGLTSGSISTLENEIQTRVNEGRTQTPKEIATSFGIGFTTGAGGEVIPATWKAAKGAKAETDVNYKKIALTKDLNNTLELLKKDGGPQGKQSNGWWDKKLQLVKAQDGSILDKNAGYWDVQMMVDGEPVNVRKTALEILQEKIPLNRVIRPANDVSMRFLNQAKSGGFIDLGAAVYGKDAIPKELQPLAEEARKYKTAEEFINSQGQRLYHGGAGVDELNKGVKILSPEQKLKYPSSGGGYYGLSTTADKNYALEYSRNIAGRNDVAEMLLKPNAKVFELKTGAIDDMSENELVKLAKKYDVIKSVEDNEFRILNEKAVSTPSQLTDLFNKAKQQNPQGGFADFGAKVDRTKLSGRQLDMPNSKLTQKTQLPVQEMGGIGAGKSPTASIAQGGELPYTATQTQGLQQGTQKTTLKTLLKGDQQSTQAVKIDPSFERIIQDGYKEIGSLKDEGKAPIKQKLSESWDKFYTDWVDRYHPISKATDIVEKSLAQKGAVLRPENNPKYVIRKFLGMGGIAEQRFQSELKPVLDLADQSGIAKQDLDLYLKSKRDINLSQRGIAGSDANVAAQRIQALQGKYGQNLDQIASKMYEYQSKGFNELVQAGFISPDQAKQIQDLNQNYVPFQRIMDEVDEFLGIPTKKAVQSANPLQKIKGSEKQIYSPVESIIANTYKQRAAIEKNNVARSVADLAQSMPELGFKTVSKAGNDTIPVWRNGVKEYVQVGTEISDSLKGMNEEQMNNVLKLFTGPASLLRQGATGRNPDFMIPNIIRDQLDAAINSKAGYVPFLDYARGFASILKNDSMYQEWQSSGASQNLSSLSGRKAVSEMLNEKKARKNLFAWIGKGLDVMGKYSEEPTRVGLYKKAKEKTGNKMLAMMDSREGTMDFARMGAKMKVANAMIPFLNVGVQGFDKLIRSAKENPARFALKLGAIAALPQATVTAYNLVNHPEEYKDVPQYEKDGNFVIVTGRNEDGTVSYISIPKGNLAQLAANPVDSFMTFVAGRNSQTVGQFATQFLSSTLPVVAEGQSIKEVALKTVGSNLPQAVKPITENLLNKSFYKYNPDSEQSKEIVPQYLQKKAPGDQSYEWTPTLYKAVGKVAGVSPLQVQNLAEGYFAGYSKIPAQLVDILKNISEGKPVDPNQKTIIRRIFKQTYPVSESQKKKKAEASPLIGQASAAEGIPKPLPEFNRGQITARINAQGKDMASLEKKYFSIDDKTKEDIKNRVKNKSSVSDSELSAAYLGKEITEYSGTSRQSKLLGKLDDIERDKNLSNEQKAKLRNTLAGKAGITKTDVNYYAIANKPIADKVQFVKGYLEKQKDKSGLGAMLYSLNGKKILSNGVVDALIEEGVFSKGEGKYLKSLKYDDKTKSLKRTVGSLGAGKSKVTDSEILSAFNKTLKAMYGQSTMTQSSKKLSDYYKSRRQSFKLKK